MILWLPRCAEVTCDTPVKDTGILRLLPAPAPAVKMPARAPVRSAGAGICVLLTGADSQPSPCVRARACHSTEWHGRDSTLCCDWKSIMDIPRGPGETIAALNQSHISTMQLSARLSLSVSGCHLVHAGFKVCRIPARTKNLCPVQKYRLST